MIAADAVVVYRIFGLSLDALFALFRVIVTSAIIILTLRIPFKRKYHWMFLIVEIAMLWYSSGILYEQLAPNVATYLSRASTLYTSPNWATTDVQVLLIFQFLVYFVSRRESLWEKLVSGAGYAFAAVTVWVPLVVDPAFNAPGAHTTVFGITINATAAAPYLRPDGIDIYVTLMAIPIFFLLIRYYRSDKSPIVRGQTKYLIIGLILFYAGSYATYLTQQNTSLPNLSNLIFAGGDFILLLGLRRKGFYAVTPVAETATMAMPIKYPLQEAHSYLAHDQKSAFESFSELVKSGHEGLMITRTFPQNVRNDYGIQTTPIRWLAEEKGADGIPPGDLLGLSLTIKDFFDKAKRPVVMLQGVEYLTTINGFTPTLRLIQGLSEQNSTKNGILILPVLPKSLNEQDEALLASETIPMPMPAGA